MGGGKLAKVLEWASIYKKSCRVPHAILIARLQRVAPGGERATRAESKSPEQRLVALPQRFALGRERTKQVGSEVRETAAQVRLPRYDAVDVLMPISDANR